MLPRTRRYDLQRYEKKLYQSPKSFQQSAFFPHLHYNGLKRTSINTTVRTVTHFYPIVTLP